MSPTPPERSAEQRAAALEMAARVRKVRAEVKLAMKSGEMSFADLLETAASDEMLARLKVRTALEALPRLGKVNARRLMRELDIAETRRIKGLGPRQREGILNHPLVRR